MPNLVKKIDDGSKLQARMALRKLLRSLPEEDKATYDFSVASTCALLDVSPSTLFEARKKRKLHEAEGKPITPLELASIPFVATSPPVYMAIDLLQYIDRLGRARLLKIEEQDDPKHYADMPDKYPGAVGAVLGFQTWLGQAGPTEVWPFAIGKNERPRDLIEAQLAKEAGTEFEWLTIREFGERCADAASREANEAEAKAIAGQIRKPRKTASKAAPIRDRKDRWKKPSGPI